jgi:hypothetical protein
MDDEIQCSITGNCILLMKTRISLSKGKPEILFGSFSRSGKEGENSKSEAMLYVTVLGEATAR